MQADLLGYNFHVRNGTNAPGCSQLDVTLRPQPTRLHFDPEKIHLTVAAPSGDVQRMTITRGWNSGPEPAHVCAGRIVLEDRLEKRVQFMTLGGSLTSAQEDGGVTLCHLFSPAPIIELARGRDVPEILAEEIEGLLARRRAFWDGRRREFDRRLAEAAPEQLYAACLSTLRRKFGEMRFTSAEDDAARLSQFIDVEMATLYGSSGRALSVPALEDIL